MPSSLEILWHDADGIQRDIDYIMDDINLYTKKGGVVYIGADSMMNCTTCSFASVIALHDHDQKVAKYYFKKLKKKESKYKDVKLKILEEVNIAIQTAELVLKICPSAKVELHVDISTEKANLTSRFYALVKGWVSGMGFKLKVKPESWASSSIADWHTK